MLESLRQGTANIHQLNLDGAFPEPVTYRPRELYEELKLTPLYDAERGQWNRMMSKEQGLMNANRNTDAQLLGVLVEAQFNPAGAQALYERLKTTPLYDAPRGQWNLYMSKEQELRGTDRNANAQLLGVLVEAHFRQTEAQALYERLKTTPLYDSAHGQWNLYMSKEQELRGTDREVDGQLLGVLVEAQFSPEGARTLYERLKATPLYDAQRRQWYLRMSKEQELWSTGRVGHAQLLGVLVEAQFNPERARALYEKLKDTPLYDTQREQWNWSMSKEQDLSNTVRGADAQLLGVLVEAKLLSAVPQPLIETIPPLPITEDW